MDPDLVLTGDFVMGAFIGDSDALIIRCDPYANDFGSLIVCNAISGRAEWTHVSTSLSAFLDAFEASNGDKFWESAIMPHAKL